MSHLPPIPTDAAKETTTDQSRTGLPGFSAAGLAGFLPAPSGSYQTYREISAYPTAALVRGMIAAPIVANSWRWKKSRDDVPDAFLAFVSSVLDPLRQSIVTNTLRALEYGWTGFEKIWEIENGRRILRRLKPLLWDCTEILIDYDPANGWRPVVLKSTSQPPFPSYDYGQLFE
jgi:hypothetical protein